MIRGLTVDAQGNIYVCGPTASRKFPTTPGAYMTTFAGNIVVHEGGHQFVAKFSPAGKLVWSTLLGNPKAGEFCVCMNVKVDKAGFVYVSGGAGKGLCNYGGVVPTQISTGAPGRCERIRAQAEAGRLRHCLGQLRRRVPGSARHGHR